MIKAMLIKEFLLVLRDRYALAALFVMPAVFILIMSLALQDAFNDQRGLGRYAVVDLDHSRQSIRLTELLAANTQLEGRTLSKAAAADGAKASRDDTQFVITVPPEFGRKLEGSALKKAPRLRIEVQPDVKKELLALFQAQVVRAFMELRLAAIGDKLARISPPAGREFAALSLDPSTMLEVQVGDSQADRLPTSVQQSVPAWIVFGMFFVIIPMSTIFINERKQNTLMRLCAMNVSLPLHFVGKIVPYMLINQLQVWVMIAVGMFIVPRCGGEALGLGESIPGLFLISLALSLAAIGLSMLIAVLVESVEQATTIGGIINVLLGAIGGVMVPKFVMPPYMQKLSAISPMSWGLEGFLDIFLRGQGVRAVLGEVLALTGFALLSLAGAALLFRVKVRRGM